MIKEREHMISQNCLHDALSYGKCFTGLGRPADYIPELARVNKHQLGVCIVSLDGEILKEGAYDRPFTIQSISKDEKGNSIGGIKILEYLAKKLDCSLF